MYCKSDGAAGISVTTFSVLFATKVWGDDNDTRLVLISLRSIMGEETVSKQGHLIYSEPHMTFSTNWCEILCSVTNSWLLLTHYLWFSLSSSYFFSIYHLFPFSPPPFFHSFSQRCWQSSSHHRFKRGWLFFMWYSSALFVLNELCIVSLMGWQKMYFHEYFQHFSIFHKLQIVF